MRALTYYSYIYYVLSLALSILSRSDMLSPLFILSTVAAYARLFGACKRRFLFVK